MTPNCWIIACLPALICQWIETVIVEVPTPGLNSIEPFVMNVALKDLFYPNEEWSKLLGRSDRPEGAAASVSTPTGPQMSRSWKCQAFLRMAAVSPRPG